MWEIIANPTLLNPDLLWQKFTKLHYYSNFIICTLHWAQQSKPIVLCVCMFVAVFVLNGYSIFWLLWWPDIRRNWFWTWPLKADWSAQQEKSIFRPSLLSPLPFLVFFLTLYWGWWCEILATIMVIKACCCCPAGLERNSLGNEVSC